MRKAASSCWDKRCWCCVWVFSSVAIEADKRLRSRCKRLSCCSVCLSTLLAAPID
ncbi:MAG: hypothetical protein ACRC38_08530 [Plesiomonas sp.]